MKIDDVHALCSVAEVSPGSYRRFSGALRFGPVAPQPASAGSSSPIIQEAHTAAHPSLLAVPEFPSCLSPAEGRPAPAREPIPIERHQQEANRLHALGPKRRYEKMKVAEEPAAGEAPPTGAPYQQVRRNFDCFLSKLASADSAPSRLGLRRALHQSRGEASTRFGRRTAQMVVPVYAVAGGVGVTTVIATLGRALSLMGETVVLVDSDSPSLLPFHFSGGERVAPHHRDGSGPLHVVAPSDANRESDEWLHAGLSRYAATQVLIDASGSFRDQHHQQFLSQGNPIVVLTPEVRSILAIAPLLKFFASHEKAQPIGASFLLTQFAPSLPIHVEIHQELQNQLGDRLLPFIIERSDQFLEALADGLTIMDAASTSRNARMFFEIARYFRSFTECRLPGAHTA